MVHRIHPARRLRAGLHGAPVYQGLTVGYCIALTQFVMVGTLGLMYLRRAERVYDPLAEKAAQRALATERERLPAGSPADGDTREEGSR